MKNSSVYLSLLQEDMMGVNGERTGFIAEEKLDYIESESERSYDLEEDGKSSIFDDWAQVNLDELVIAHLDQLAQNKTAMRIFLFILQHMDRYNAVQCSFEVMSEALNLSRPTLARGVKYLKDHGTLYIMKSGNSNIYLLNPKIAWKSWSSNYKYCEFPVNVILGANEQDKDYPYLPEVEAPKVKEKRIKTVQKENQKNLNKTI